MRCFITFYAMLAVFFAILSYGVCSDEYAYDSGGKRDPFIPMILGGIKASLGLEAVENIDDINFEGIIFDPSGISMAILNGKIVKAGDKINNVKILDINRTSINITIYDEPYTISSVEEGGGIN